MQTWLIEAQLALVFFAVLVPVLLAPWVDRQYARFGRVAGWPAVVSVATALYVCALVAFTMFPLPTETPTFCRDRARFDYWQTSPMGSLDDIAVVYDQFGLAHTLTSAAFLQVAFNVVFFLPLGFLLAHRWRRGIVSSTLIGFAVSLAIESTQGTGIWGIYECPYRLADVDDLITNTAGAVAGWILGRLLNPVLPDPRPDPAADLAPPGLPRRILAVGLDALVWALAVLGAAVMINVSRGSLDNRQAIETQGLPFAELQLAIIVVLFVGVPLVRRSRATPGLACVDGRPVSAATGARATWWQVGLRAAVRWGPVPFLGIAWLAAIGVVDLVVGRVRADGRTLVDLVSGTRVVTERAFQTQSEVRRTPHDAAPAAGTAAAEWSRGPDRSG